MEQVLGRGRQPALSVLPWLAPERRYETEEDSVSIVEQTFG